MQAEGLAPADFPLLSFFTGAGFLDMGFMKAGFEVVWHNELNKKFAEGFTYGMTKWCEHTQRDSSHIRNLNTTSIELLKKRGITLEAFNAGRLPLQFGIIGGPPCPDFSVGGKNRGKDGEHGRLSQTFVDLICALRPTFFLFENVPGLLRTAKHKRFLTELRKQLDHQGYVTDIALLNALEYGVPQDRARVMMVGFNEDWLKRFDKMPDPRPSYAKLERQWFRYPEPIYRGAKELAGWPTKKPFGRRPGRRPKSVPHDLMVGTHIMAPGVQELENSDDKFRTRSPKFYEIAEGDDSRKSFKRLHRYRYSPTAAYGNNEVHLHPTEPRRLSVREAMIIQSVPNEYALPSDMTLTDKFKTVGNGVPVALAEAMAVAIWDFLSTND